LGLLHSVERNILNSHSEGHLDLPNSIPRLCIQAAKTCLLGGKRKDCDVTVHVIPVISRQAARAETF